MNTLIELVNDLKKKEGIAVTYFTGYRHFNYTYIELYELICRTAALLARSGIKRKDAVLIWGANKPEWAVAFLACIIRGAIAVPIDVRHTLEFVKKVQKQTNAKLIVSNIHLPEIKTLSLDSLFYSVASISPEEPKDYNEKDIVEILYTSGTTGDPKGVILTHKNFCASLLAMQMLRPERHIVLSVLPLSHIFEQVVGLLLPLHMGGKIIYPPFLKPRLLLEIINKERVTVLLLVPRMMELLLAELKKHRLFSFCSLTKTGRMLFAPSLRLIVVGGAKLETELERAWEHLGFCILQGYGLTETTALLTCLLPDVHAHGSVGKAVPGVEISIVHDEILARGDNVFNRYFRNKKKTMVSFSKGWFRTGDMGLVDSNGFLYIKGRKKDMIKTSSGFNVYPEDIEAVLRKYSGVKDACVIGIPTKKGEKIHAVLLIDKGNGSPEEIIANANKQLDDVQRITDYSVWPENDFPRTPTRKIRKFEVLAAVQKGIKEIQKEKVPPVQSVIAQLTTKRITPTAQLRDLGLSSLDRVELATLLEQEFLTDIDENELTGETTVREVEALVAKGVREMDKHIRRWTTWKVINLLRILIQHVLFIFIAIICRRTVHGKENLAGVKGSVIVVANHASHLDTPVVIMSLPLSLRARIAPAAWEEYFFGEQNWRMKIYQLFAYNFVTLFWNAFMFPQTRGFRKALRYAGELADNGWNILVFPEGERTTTGKLLPFKNGIGFLAKELRIPVIPIKLEGIVSVLPRGRIIPSPGKVAVKIGKPMTFTKESVVEITTMVEKAVRDL